MTPHHPTSSIFHCYPLPIHHPSPPPLKILIIHEVTIFGRFLDLNVQTNIRSFYFYPKVKYENLHLAFQFVVSSLACKYQLKYQWLTKYQKLEMSKKENVTGRLHWQGKAHTRSKNRRFFWSLITGDYHDSCDFIRKIAFTFVGKNKIGMF